MVVETLVALEYPNGRTHEAILFGESALLPGQEFDLHGRRWRAVDLPVRRRPLASDSLRLLCKAVGTVEVRARAT